MTKQNYSIKLEECKWFKIFRFIRSCKDDIISKLKENHKLLSLDKEQQTQIYKKLQESVTENTKHYNEVFKSMKSSQ